jgi:plasmid stabilization system protein ParE
MRYVLITSDEAFLDIENGVEYYNSQKKGLGKRFAITIKKTFADIRKMPMSASFIFDDTRYKVVAKFPYNILYRVQGNIIFIARVFNTHQRPIY